MLHIDITVHCTVLNLFLNPHHCSAEHMCNTTTSFANASKLQISKMATLFAMHMIIVYVCIHYFAKEKVSNVGVHIKVE